MGRLLLILILIPQLVFGQFVNLGFEEWDAESQSFSSWFGVEGTVIQMSDKASQGQKALSLQSEADLRSAYFFQAQDLDIGVPRRLTFSGMVNTQNFNGKAGIYVTVRGPKGRTYYNQAFSKGSDSWVNTDIEILIDDHSNQIFIGGILIGEGQARYDQFDITEKKLENGYVSNATKFIDEIGRVIQHNSLVADELDLEGLLTLGRYLVSADSSLEATYPVIDFLVSKLADKHSRLMSSEDFHKWNSDVLSMAGVKGEIIGDVAHVEIPGFRSDNDRQIIAYISHLRT